MWNFFKLISFNQRCLPSVGSRVVSVKSNANKHDKPSKCTEAAAAAPTRAVSTETTHTHKIRVAYLWRKSRANKSRALSWTEKTHVGSHLPHALQISPATEVTSHGGVCLTSCICILFTMQTDEDPSWRDALESILAAVKSESIRLPVKSWERRASRSLVGTSVIIIFADGPRESNRWAAEVMETRYLRVGTKSSLSLSLARSLGEFKFRPTTVLANYALVREWLVKFPHRAPVDGWISGNWKWVFTQCS